jgi:hypothetical protein
MRPKDKTCMYVVCMYVVCTVCLWCVLMLHDDRYLEPPIPVVQRRVRVNHWSMGQHPNSQTPHTSNSVKNCVLTPPHQFVI